MTLVTSSMVTLLAILSMASHEGLHVILQLPVLHTAITLLQLAALVLFLPAAIPLDPLPTSKPTRLQALIRLTTFKCSPSCMMPRLLCHISRLTNNPEFLLPSLMLLTPLYLLRPMLFLVRIFLKICLPYLLVMVTRSLTRGLPIIFTSSASCLVNTYASQLPHVSLPSGATAPFTSIGFYLLLSLYI